MSATCPAARSPAPARRSAEEKHLCARAAHLELATTLAYARKGFRDMFGEMRSAFPDLYVEVERLTATDDDVAIAYTLTGTHRGTLMGHAATVKTVRVRGVQIARFADGKVVERWGSSDQLGMLTQLGLA
jgi:steroid delta-isomerase-like uncharacterized protein